MFEITTVVHMKSFAIISLRAREPGMEKNSFSSPNVRSFYHPPPDCDRTRVPVVSFRQTLCACAWSRARYL